MSGFPLCPFTYRSPPLSCYSGLRPWSKPPPHPCAYTNAVVYRRSFAGLARAQLRGLLVNLTAGFSFLLGFCLPVILPMKLPDHVAKPEVALVL